MVQPTQLLLAGRSETVLNDLALKIEGQSDLRCQIQVLQSSSVSLPDAGQGNRVTLLLLSGDGQHELEALARAPRPPTAPLLVLGQQAEVGTLHLALRGGARDFLSEPVDIGKLIAVVHRLGRELGGPPARQAQSTLVLGAAGGVGTSLVACNLALGLQESVVGNTLLLDLDLDFAPLPGFLDLSPGRGLTEALDNADKLDAHALQGYVSRHASGLTLLASAHPDGAGMVGGRMGVERFAALLDLLEGQYRHLVLDGGRGLGGLAATAAQRAGRVVVVLQQSVLQLRAAAELLQWLEQDLALPAERIQLVVNRRNRRAAVTEQDIRRTLGQRRLFTLPSHYPSALGSLDSGVPLLRLSPRNPLARGLRRLGRELHPESVPGRSGPWRRLLRALRGA